MFPNGNVHVPEREHTGFDNWFRYQQVKKQHTNVAQNQVMGSKVNKH